MKLLQQLTITGLTFIWLLLTLFLINGCQEDIAIPKDASQIKSFLESERATMILKYNEIHASTQQQYLLNTSSSNYDSQAFEDVWGTVIDGTGAIFQDPNQPTVLVEPILDQDNEIKHFLITWSLNSNAQFRIVPVEQPLTDKTLDNTPIPQQLSSISITSSNISVDINTNPGCSSTTNTSFDATDCTWTTTVSFCSGYTYEWTSGGDCGGSSGGGTSGGISGGNTTGGNTIGGGETTDPECIQDMTDFGDNDQPYNDEPNCANLYRDCIDNGGDNCWQYCQAFDCSDDDQALYNWNNCIINNESCEDYVFFDQSFLDDPIANCVYDKLASVCGNLFEQTIGQFQNDPELHLTFRKGNCATTNTACTDSDEIDETKNVTITIENYPSQLELATLLLHEAIHANIAAYLFNEEHDLANENMENTLRLLQLYQLYKGEANYADHIFIAEKYIEPISNALWELNDYQYTLDHYKYFAWSGIKYWDPTQTYITTTDFNHFRDLAFSINLDPWQCD